MQLSADLAVTEFPPQQLKKKRVKECIQDSIEKIREHEGLTFHSLFKAESIHEVKVQLFIKSFISKMLRILWVFSARC